jgi:transcriptional regulator with XRE-family HTH domain
MKSQFVKNMIKEMPEDIKLFSSIYAELTLKISETLKEKGLTQKDLADKLDKRPSEISKWLNGEHNFTLRSLCKLQCELDIKLIEVPRQIKFTAIKSDEFISKKTISWEAKTSKKSTNKVIPISRNVEYTNKYMSLAN